MATKVKGESIKESSVPFSALENFRYDLSDEVDYAKFKNALEDEKAGFIITQNDIIDNVYIIFSQNIGGNFYNLRGIDRTKVYETTIDISNNPTTIFRKQDEIEHIVPIDWNAQEGEAGYIKNKTHYVTNISIGRTNYTLIKDIPKRYNYDYDHYYLSEEIYIQYNEDEYIGRIKIPINTVLGDSEYSTFTIKIKDQGEEFILSSYYDGTNILFKVIKADVGTDFKVLIYTPLNDNYIPNTVLKTTPQTLLNADKKQALANLGLDIVKLKYISEPWVIDDTIFDDDGFNGDIVDQNLCKLITAEPWCAINRFIYSCDGDGTYTPCTHVEVYNSNIFTLKFRSTYVVILDISTGQIKDITNG